MREEDQPVSLEAYPAASQEPKGERMSLQVDQIMAVWTNESMTNSEVACSLGIGTQKLARIAKVLGLPPRAKNVRTNSFAELTEEEYEARKREARERHIAARRAESSKATVRRLEREKARMTGAA